ncbi:Heavy metal-associated isoprenylated plant protein 26 [Apostasia shenzhenica]|uniref:Heavy metal-associated isoprenylated plant protein 26 n=1 Tax=Apostasia shenzhenica TaxID=1088818 RepID=A0A2I0BCH9_9ASPA|nr:Heavy metal-associated isoprenylated plant protein 26 [Apostasia shenzhenica]
MELKVYMHCKACERLVLKTVTKLKGVEEAKVDMNEHKAMIIGEIEPEKLLKQIKKKTGKRAEIITLKEVGVSGNKKCPKSLDCNEEMIDQNNVVFEDFNHSKYDIYFKMFSDDNPNACLIIS